MTPPIPPTRMRPTTARQGQAQTQKPRLRTALVCAVATLACGCFAVAPVTGAQAAAQSLKQIHSTPRMQLGTQLGTQPMDNNDLDQTVSGDEEQAKPGTRKVVKAGHMDISPVIEQGKLSLQLRDDSEEKPVWRSLDDVVFELGEPAKQVLPDSGDFTFTGAKAGDAVWASPQAQIANVPWIGWNTQSPTLGDTRGVTFEYVGHSGEGTFTVFEQAGGFSQPQVLWSSQKGQPRKLWVERNTHTHANWVFSRPGVHLVRMRITTDGDGKNPGLSGEATLRFAVGGADSAQAFDATWQAQDGAGAAQSEGAETQGASGSATTRENSQESQQNAEQDSVPTMLIVVLVVGALILAGGVGIYLRHNAKLRRQMRVRTQDTPTGQSARTQGTPTGETQRTPETELPIATKDPRENESTRGSEGTHQAQGPRGGDDSAGGASA
ncbi:choice-of-anchor M domain-containing protein [Gleimia hominis]|uniref:Choice-of-anchor M domain-containing protein n=1 Tax=Gleimia hominis TaxID=595468 RepID=A0ABU3I9S3_9ACTO|nr:choice-of-anchor M domain-containing protein [Gleimia hominis]MDT3767113.1 choice-of-anchor M domain-containing protein [Gleimia hominis]